MKSLLEIHCPHCGAHGQVKVPPVGALVIGPCPRCHELVMIFAGAALPLNRAIIVEGDKQTKRDHLMDVLTTFLDTQVERLVEQMPGGEEAPGAEVEADEPEGGQPFYEAGADSESAGEQGGGEDEGPQVSPHTISDAELAQFVDVDLRLLDNKEYFHTVFRN